MDDFDDLLDEIEKEFAQKEKQVVPKSAKAKKDAQINQNKGQKPCHEWDVDDIDQDVDDILNGDGEISGGHLGKEAPGASQKSKKSDCYKAKCFPLHLGGCNVPKGLSTGRQKKACNNLRCTSCDFKVLIFDNFQWHSSADYLFFRNTMPDKSKLQRKLGKLLGCVAYCCQCSWKSIREPTAMSQFKELKWVCGRH